MEDVDFEPFGASGIDLDCRKKQVEYNLGAKEV